MTKLLSAAALLGALMFIPVGAQAFPAASPAAESDIITVAQGCGPGWGRDRFGVCRPFARGPVIRQRACWWVQTVYGPRRVCR